ncbi:hypothetical protein ACHAW6_012512 [Cyclotella cf. meneghiniana]
MANALEKNEPLESVWIDNSCIGASGLEILARSLVNNKKLKKLHLSHNSFQSLHPLICCTFNKDSLVAIADSNLTLKYVFLNRRYSYECDEADIVLDTNPKLLPLMCEMLGETSYLSTVFSALRDLSSFVLMFHENKDKESKNHQMDVDFMCDKCFLSRHVVYDFCFRLNYVTDVMILHLSSLQCCSEIFIETCNRDTHSKNDKRKTPLRFGILMILTQETLIPTISSQKISSRRQTEKTLSFNSYHVQTIQDV